VKENQLSGYRRKEMAVDGQKYPSERKASKEKPKYRKKASKRMVTTLEIVAASPRWHRGDGRNGAA